MMKKRYYLIGLLAALLLGLLVLPQKSLAETKNQQLVQGWLATYWNNKQLEGSPVLQRYETTIDHNWGLSSPGSGVVSSDFSARWLGAIEVPAGLYRFTVTADDGVRVWVDDDLIINEWRDQAATTFSAVKSLSQGRHIVSVEYYENAGDALIRFTWAPESFGSGEWQGEYFNNVNLVGSPIVIRYDSAINFDWGQGSPFPGTINSDMFSARWTRTVNFASGTYQFILRVDDGGRLWINDRLLIDAWRVQSPQTYAAVTSLSGPANLRVEYFENTENAQIQLNWNPVGAPPPPDDGNGDGGYGSVDWTQVFAPNWPERVPRQWHQPIRACMIHFNQINRPLRNPPDTEAIIEDCIVYLNNIRGRDYSQLRQFTPLLIPRISPGKSPSY